MTKKILRIYSHFVSFILALVGIGGFFNLTSCDKGNVIAEYGAPVGKFKILGKVMAQDSTEIPAIGVLLQNSDTVFTDTSGNYSVDIFDNPESQTYILKFRDRDGAVNGTYLPKDTTVSFNNPQFQNGEVSKVVNVQLEEDN